MQKTETIVRLLAGCVLLAAGASAAHASATYLGSAYLPKTATDQSGLSDTLEDGASDALLSFGSAITYSGFGDIFYALPDRGPNASTYDASVDNTTSFKTRYETMRIVVNTSTFNGTPGTATVSIQNVGTTLFTNESGQNLIGKSDAYTGNVASQNLRFDPEGIARSKDGKYVYVSDEYGPNLYKFDAVTGQRVGVITLPSSFYISNLSTQGSNELNNTSGRQANRGMEGLAISPDGGTLFGIMQNALIQDHALNASNSRVGLNNRMVKVDLATGATQEYVYHLENKSNGVNEILAVNDHQFLVIERDGKYGNEAAFKKIYLIDTTGASDVSGVASLPQTNLDPGTTAVSKTLFIDLLSELSSYFVAPGDLAGEHSLFPEKFEGLAWGKDIDTNGDTILDAHTLLVTTDNDFSSDSYVFAFAISYADLPGFVAQAVPEPASLGVIAIGAAMLLGRRRK